MRKYLLIVTVLFLTLQGSSQNVFNSGDPVINYNSGATYGTSARPDSVVSGRIVKWVRTRNTGRIPWDDTKFKCYYANYMAFRLRYPNNYDSTKKYPLIVFFHGAGETGWRYENEDQLFWGASTFQSAIDGGNFNGFLLFPQQTSAGWGDNYFPIVNMILDTLTKYNGLDPDRVTSMGLSEGGYGACLMANLYPKRIASVVTSSPIDIKNIHNEAAYVHVPIWMANGGVDAAPNPWDASYYASSLHNLGSDFRQQYYSTQGHAIWAAQWAQQDINQRVIMYDYWNNAHKAQPLVFFQNTVFCAGSAISCKLGLTAGYYAYQWQRSSDGGATYADIPGATANEYTATTVGLYRVHFKRDVTSNWSDWTPKPVEIITKPCSLDTVFAENFEYDKSYLNDAPWTEWKMNQFDCQNAILTSGAESFTNDATGTPGKRFWISYTNPNRSVPGLNYTTTECVYSTNDKIWGMYNNWPTVIPNTNYLFNFYASNQTTTSPRAVLTAKANGITLTNLLTKPTSLPSGTTGNFSWTKFTYLWNSGSSTSFDGALYLNSTATTGNDFALDEISLTRQLAPGGVSANMALWAKADAVSAIDSAKLFDWSNASGATPLTQTAVSNKPLLLNNPSENINFNPLVGFSTTNDLYLSGVGGYAASGTHSAAHVYLVAKTVDSIATDSVIVERGNSTSTKLAIGLNIKGNITWDAGSTSGGSHLTTAASYADLNKPVLWTFSKDNANNTGSGNKQDIRKNGLVLASSASSPSYTSNGANFKIGSSNVKVAEAIYYIDANINSVSQNRIESYLATKYGITLGTPASPTSYVASDGVTVFWPANPTFQNDVFGLGVDSLSGLNQLQSNSINSGSGDGTGQKGKGNLVLTAISSLGDKDFLMIGSDATTLAEHIIQPGEAPSQIQTAKRVGREWRVENTGNVGQVTVTFDTTGLTLAGGAVLGNFALLMDSDGDGDFNTGTPSLFYATSSGGKQIRFSGVTLNDNTVFTIITQKSSNSLPAIWLGFTAEAVNGNGVLHWTTSEEVNVDYYAVEHSTNGADFTVIGMKPANNSMGVNNYYFTQQSLSAGTHYYRIRRVDRDGVFAYSEVQTIKISAVNAIQVRPNPVTGSTLTLALSMQQKARSAVQVITLDGKVMVRNNVLLQQGLNTINVNVDALPTGIYLVQVLLNDEMVTKKFVRTR